MVKQTRKAELEGLSVLYLESMCHGAGLDASGSKAQLIDRLLKSEGQVPAEPETEPEPEPQPEPEN